MTKVKAQQVSLSSSLYTKTLDGIFGGFPNGWSGRTTATAIALSFTQTLNPAVT